MDQDKWLEDIRAAVAHEIKLDAKRHGQLTLGEFIDCLEKLPHEAKCMFDTGTYVGEPDSYRGYYDHLAFEPEILPSTVGDVLRFANKANGKTFQGYRGGNFIMHRGTLVWLGSYGTTAGSKRIVGVNMVESIAIIATIEDDQQ
jgi:hypothetical protein